MSDDIAIRVENLGKRYIIGRETRPPETLGGRLRQLAGSPFSWLATQMRAPSEEEILWALKDVSFEVKRGEVLGVIGRNGAGKSTLLKILSRITEPTTGHAEIHGRVGSLLEVGTGMHPELTGRENIYLNGTILGMRKAEIDAKFDEIVDFSGIERFLDTPVKRYSSGMRVRLGFAIAAHLEPEILVIDEVLAVGDVEFQKKCLGKMKDVVGHGRTVLLVSHNSATIASLATQSLYLKNGGVEAAGQTAEILKTYVDSFSLGTRPGDQEGVGDRPGNKRVRILDLSFLTDHGRDVVSGVSSGGLLVIKIDMSIPSTISPRDLIFGTSFWDEGGRMIASFTNDEMREFCTENSPQSTSIYLQIPRLMLRPSPYRVRVFVSLWDTSPRNLCDLVENAGTIIVLPTSYWRVGKPIRSYPGALIDADYTDHHVTE